MKETFTGRVAAMMPAWGGLLLWGQNFHRLNCPVSALFLVLAAVSLALASTEVAFYRRRAFLSHYLVPQGLLFRLLKRRVLILVWHGAKALVLSAILLVACLHLSLAEWLVLLADVLLMAYLTTGLSRFLGKEVKAPYRVPMARHWAVRDNAFTLWIALVAIGFFSPQASYEGLGWEEVAVLGASGTAPGCDALALLARIDSVAEALAFWGAQNLFATLRHPEQLLMAWLAFIASFGVSFLLAWLYSRVLAGILSRPFAIWRHGEDED